MIYSYEEVKKKYKDDYNLRKALKNSEIFKLDKGIYSDKSLVDPMVIICKKYSNAIITMDSAFYYYDLTDVVPDKIFIATNMHSKKLTDSNIFQIFVSEHLLDIGKTQITTDDGIINIYDKERLLIELIRKKQQIGYDYYKEIINNYRNISHTLNTQKLEEYVSFFNNEDYLLNVIQNEVF